MARKRSRSAEGMRVPVSRRRSTVPRSAARSGPGADRHSARDRRAERGRVRRLSGLVFLVAEPGSEAAGHYPLGIGEDIPRRSENGEKALRGLPAPRRFEIGRPVDVGPERQVGFRDPDVLEAHRAHRLGERGAGPPEPAEPGIGSEGPLDPRRRDLDRQDPLDEGRAGHAP